MTGQVCHAECNEASLSPPATRFAALRMTPFDRSHCQGLFLVVEPCLSLSTSQDQFPCFTDEIMAEAMMRFLGNEFKPGFLVDVTGFQQDTIGPEH